MSQRFSCAFGEYDEFPLHKVRSPAQVTELDLSHNNFSDVGFLASFPRLEALVLDSNQIGSQTKFPPLPHLHTLWLNKNNVINLSYFVDTLVSSCPNIRYLSMLNNPACPNYFNGGTQQQYHDYRLFVVSRFKQLLALDDSKVTAEERAESEKIYGHFKKQGKQNDPGRLGAKIKKKKIRVSTQFAATNATLSPQNDHPGVSSGPQPRATVNSTPTHQRPEEEEAEEEEEDEEEEVVQVSSPRSPIVSLVRNGDDEESSDWSTDSGDVVTPLRAELNRRLSPPSPMYAEEVSTSPSSKRGELLRTLHEMQPKKKVNFSDDHQAETHREPKGEAVEGKPEEEEEEPRQAITVRPKKKRGNDALHLELQARLGLKSNGSTKQQEPSEEEPPEEAKGDRADPEI